MLQISDSDIHYILIPMTIFRKNLLSISNQVSPIILPHKI